MSTHNIGFYEEISKIISQLSSNIIKYTLYLFFFALSTDGDRIILLTKCGIKASQSVFKEETSQLRLK